MNLAQRIALALAMVGSAAIGLALWGLWGWEPAVAWWGACALAAGVSEFV